MNWMLGSLVLVSVATVTYLTYRDPLVRSARDDSLGTALMWPALCLPALISGTVRWNFVQTAICLSGAYALVIAGTLGRPVMMMDQLFSRAWLRKPDQARLFRRIRLSQAIVLTLMCAWVAVVLLVVPPGGA